jgi:DNA-binding response OmpR family regulator
MQKSKILVIEDNEDTLKFLSLILSAEFETILAENAVIGIDFARNQNPDLILLDIMLPHLNGLDALQLLRADEKTSATPVIILSAKNRSNDITAGLDIGADDYVSKPFDAKELIARIKARLRISQSRRAAADMVSIGDLRIDVLQRKVTYLDKTIDLTLTEFDILRCLTQNSGEVVTRKKIIEFVWTRSKKEINDRTIDVHIRSIRKKIPDIGKHLTSVYGVGYRYNR